MKKSTSKNNMPASSKMKMPASTKKTVVKVPMKPTTKKQKY